MDSDIKSYNLGNLTKKQSDAIIEACKKLGIKVTEHPPTLVDPDLKGMPYIDSATHEWKWATKMNKPEVPHGKEWIKQISGTPTTNIDKREETNWCNYEDMMHRCKPIKGTKCKGWEPSSRDTTKCMSLREIIDNVCDNINLQRKL